VSVFFELPVGGGRVLRMKDLVRVVYGQRELSDALDSGDFEELDAAFAAGYGRIVLDEARCAVDSLAVRMAAAATMGALHPADAEAIGLLRGDGVPDRHAYDQRAGQYFDDTLYDVVRCWVLQPVEGCRGEACCERLTLAEAIGRFATLADPAELVNAHRRVLYATAGHIDGLNRTDPPTLTSPRNATAVLPLPVLPPLAGPLAEGAGICVECVTGGFDHVTQLGEVVVRLVLELGEAEYSLAAAR
jgi:hypothetical protein